MTNRNWRLPHGVDELLPPLASELEGLRRRVLDLFEVWGFDHIEPPIIEYLDSLLVGSGKDLDLQTLKVVDQQSGRLMGVRADMTSQAVRVDAHSRLTNGVQRLCYAGTVVFANPQGVLESRVPFKAGAEIFGSTELAADAEVVALMLDVLRSASIVQPVVLLGHMGIYRALLAELDLDPADEWDLFGAVQTKAQSDIAGLVGDGAAAEMMVALPTLMGREEVFKEAAKVLDGAPQAVGIALAALQRLAGLVAADNPDVEIRYDLSELSGYGYHNGPVFSAYLADQGRALAQGGRYDGVGATFGNARPATGFDVNLKHLLAGDVPAAAGIWAPAAADAKLREAIADLRRSGERVVCALASDATAPVHCDRVLSLENGSWVVQALGQNNGA